MRKTLLSVIGLAVFAISSFAFAATPSDINMPGFTAVQASPPPDQTGAPVALAAVDTAVMPTVCVMRQEPERSLVDGQLVADAHASPKQMGARADREAEGRNPQRLTI